MYKLILLFCLCIQFSFSEEFDLNSSFTKDDFKENFLKPCYLSLGEFNQRCICGWKEIDSHFSLAELIEFNKHLENKQDLYYIIIQKEIDNLTSKCF